MKILKDEQEEIKDPQDYGYAGDEKIEITAREFITLKSAVEAGIASTLEVFMPEVTKYVNVETSEEVFNPSFEDLSSKKVVKVMDRQATFNENNIRTQYNVSKLTREMTMAQEMAFDIHNRNVEIGVAKHITELRKLQDAKK